MSEHHGMVWWTELMTRDVEGAKAYYKDTCGWDFDVMPVEDGDYHVANRGGVPTAGVMDMSSMKHLDGVPPHWFSYFAVDDVDKSCADTKAKGGKVIREPFDMPGTGRIAILKDPTGAPMGLMTPDVAAME